MKKTLLALATMATLGMAQSAMAAPIGTASFQWAGTVPTPAVSEAGYWLVSFDGQSLLADTDTHNGVLSFENNAGVINLVDSSAFNFKVVTDAATDGGAFNPATDNVGAAFHVSLANIKSGSSGFPTDGDQGGYFTITADNQVITAETDKAYTAGQAAQIKVGKADAKTLTAEAGQKWQVVAEVAVSTTAL